MKNVVLFAFNGEFMCFMHVLLNALDMHTKGYDVRIVIEGAATKLIPEMATEGNPLHALYGSVKGKISLMVSAAHVRTKWGHQNRQRQKASDSSMICLGIPEWPGIKNRGSRSLRFNR